MSASSVLVTTESIMSLKPLAIGRSPPPSLSMSLIEVRASRCSLAILYHSADCC